MMSDKDWRFWEREMMITLIYVLKVSEYGYYVIDAFESGAGLT